MKYYWTGKYNIIKTLNILLFSFGFFWAIFFGYFYSTGLGRENIMKNISSILVPDFIKHYGERIIQWENGGLYKKFLMENKRLDDKNDLRLKNLESLISNTNGEEFNNKIFDAIDKENFYLWTIHAVVSSSRTAHTISEMNWYVNTKTEKLTLMPWDVQISDERPTFKPETYIYDEATNPLVIKIFENDVFLRERNELMWKYLSISKADQAKLEYYDTIRKTDGLVDSISKTVKDLFEEAVANFVLTKQIGQENLELKLTVKSLAPLHVESVEVTLVDGAINPQFIDVYAGDEKICKIDKVEKNMVLLTCEQNEIPYALESVVPSESEEFSYPYMVYKAKNLDYTYSLRGIELEKIEKVKLKVINNFSNEKISGVSGVFVDKSLFANLEDISKKPTEFTISHPQFILNENNEIVLPFGSYVFSENIIIPKNTKLYINPGVSIKFTNNASLVSYSSIQAIGTKAQPINVHGGASGKGGNVAVIEAMDLSEFEYVNFNGGGEITVNGVYISGMLAIHGADSILRYNTFENAKGDDSLNIKFASSTIQYNLFQNNSSDAIDYDFSEGVIEHNRFISNGNDGIDTSGSFVLIRYNDIQKSGDKCISIGEESTPLVFNNILNGCRVGIEIKDSSEPFIVNNVIVNNEIGIHEYQKKSIFDGGNGHVYNSIIWGNKEIVRLDQNSSITIENSFVQGNYEGKDNIIEDPDFNSDFTNKYSNDASKYRNGGSKDILREKFGLILNEATIGLINGFEAGL